jgi:hypothetical protein
MPCTNASTVSPLVRAAILAKTIMVVLRNIVGAPSGRDGVQLTDKKFTSVCLDGENQIHAAAAVEL